MTRLHYVLALPLVAALAPAAQADSAPRTHDGFHLQLQLGLGWYSASSDGGANESFSGVTIPSALLLGGTIGPVAVGGGLVVDYAPAPGYEQNGVSADVDVKQYIVGIGLYGDYYLDPRKNGLHVQGFAGWGGLETSVSGNVGGSDPTGLVASLGVGYEVWISDQWSAGAMGRLVYAPLDFNGVGYTTIEPAVVGTLTWH
jgi:hypothetical protein